jgi:glycosyltransferase involved in cell wall biosynthesis
MRLLVFSPYYPPHIGGLESHADEFNKYLSRKGVDIFVFTPRLPKDAPEYEIRHNDGIGAGVKIIRFPAFEIISNYPLPKFWLLTFWKQFIGLYKEKFDIVISRTRFFNTSLLALIYAKIKRIHPHTKNLFMRLWNVFCLNIFNKSSWCFHEKKFGVGVKWIHIEHGSDFVQLSSRFKTLAAKAYDHIFGRLIFKTSDINISISKSVQEFIKKFDKRNVPVIYRGIDQDEIDSILPNSEFKNNFKNKVIISWSGRLYKWKGVGNTIEAIAKLPEEIKNKIVFLVIGDGEDKKRLENKTGKEIIFIGKLSREETISLIKISDIYIHSSLPGGGLSTSLLEAMYCGCAIIATKNEGAGEILENNINGILLEDCDQKLISEKLMELIGQENLIKLLSEKAKEKTLELFSWDKAIDKYLKYLN